MGYLYRIPRYGHMNSNRGITHEKKFSSLQQLWLRPLALQLQTLHSAATAVLVLYIQAQRVPTVSPRHSAMTALATALWISPAASAFRSTPQPNRTLALRLVRVCGSSRKMTRFSDHLLVMVRTTVLVSTRLVSLPVPAV